MTTYRPHRRPARHRTRNAEYLLTCIGWTAILVLAASADTLADLLLGIG